MGIESGSNLQLDTSSVRNLTGQVFKLGNGPIDGGGFGDIWKGAYGNQQVKVELISGPKSVTGRKGSLRWIVRGTLESDVHTINQACDVWEFGMMMLELDTGVYPYAYLTDTAVYTAIVDGSLSRVPDDSETRIRRQDLAHNIREQSWQYPPKLRPSMDEILTHLETLAQEDQKLKAEHLREDAIKTLEPAKVVEYPRKWTVKGACPCT
ncbi:hypothetical protein F5146DRAFT_1175240 [Armillaria mellea]|nr:hypothetical protein F5146DRAFT_1175240 [Armillaria mellea]